MRILITGGFGFVGGRLALHLAQAGHQIVLGSRRATSSPTWLPQAEVTQIDWNDPISLKNRCQDVDVVIQAAGMNAQNCTTDPVAALSFNGVSTARLVTAACQAGVKQFIYLSTAHVYASPLAGSITEESYLRNLHPYATSHVAGEQTILNADQRGDIQGIVLRMSNAFGPPTHKEVDCWMLATNDLCRQAIEMGKLVLHSNGMQHRDFIALSEVCRVVEHFTLNTKGSVQGGVFNIGAGVSQSVLDMAKTIQKRCFYTLGFEPQLKYQHDQLITQPTPLNYRTDKLSALGISVDGCHNTEEIDLLLRYCHATFKKKKGIKS